MHDCGTYLYVRKYLIVIRARFSFLNIVLLLQKVIKLSANKKIAQPLILLDLKRFLLVDLAGIEPASESPSIEASPITVIILTFPPSAA